MLHVRKESLHIGAMPLWYLVPEGGESSPLVIVQHGYSGSKETDLPYGEMYAQVGYRVAVTEADLHGERSSEAGRKAFEDNFPVTFGNLVEQTSLEIRRVIDELGNGPVAMNGISMGGFITFLTASQDDRVAVACPHIGSPYCFWHSYHGEPEASRILDLNPLDHPERLLGTALLVQNGVLDETVPIAPARELCEKLKALGHPRLRFAPYEGVGHETPDAMHREALAWTQRYLPL